MGNNGHRGNVMSPEEFNFRQKIIEKALELYGEQTGYNITKALELLDYPHFEIMVPLRRFSNLTGSRFDHYKRPKCPECGEDMKIRTLQENDEGIRSQLVCDNKNCDTVLDSELEAFEWLEMLEPKG